MRVILRVKTGPLAGQNIHLREGQAAEIGRTQWADFNFPHDVEMADVHFAVHCARRGCIVRDLGKGSGTLVNGEPISEAILQSGDEIMAGITAFAVRIPEDGSPASDAIVIPAPAKAGGDGADVAPGEDQLPSASDLCGHLELNEEAQKLADQAQSPQQWLAALAAADQLYSALRVQSHLLPPHEAVRWACGCLRDVYGDEIAGASGESLQVAERWVDEPNEDNRRAAETAAEAANYEGAAAWVAAAAFWSGASIAPPGMDEVPPDDRLTGQGVTSALLIASADPDPTAAPERQRSFLRKATEVNVSTTNPLNHERTNE